MHGKSLHRRDRGKIKDSLDAKFLLGFNGIVQMDLYIWMARFHYPNILIQYSIIRNNENLILEQWNLIQRPQITWKSVHIGEIRGAKLAKVSA